MALPNHKPIRKTIHITQHYWPRIGGQEEIVREMCEAAAEIGGSSIVIQPLNWSVVRDLFICRKSGGRDTTVIPIPTISTAVSIVEQICSDISPRSLIKRDLKYTLAWKSFNWSLTILSPLLRILYRDSAIIVHYHYHFLATKCRAGIIFSHGVDWSRPPRTSLDREKITLLKECIKSRATKLFVANDRDFINEVNAVQTPGIRCPNTILLPNPIDLKKYSPACAASAQQLSYCKILMARNIRWDRGILEGIKAFNKLLRDGRLPSWTLEIAGAFDAQDRYFQMCLVAAREVAPDRIKFHGAVPREQVIKLIKAASITLVPSLALEGTSLAALESMALGVPCISTSIGGLNDLPTEKVDSPNPTDMSTAIVKLIENYATIRELQLKKVRQQYGKSEWGDSFSSILKEFVAEVQSQNES